MAKPLTPEDMANLRRWASEGRSAGPVLVPRDMLAALLATLDAARAAAPSGETLDLSEPPLDDRLRVAVEERDRLRAAAEDILRNGSMYHDVGSIHARLRAALYPEDET